MYVASLALPSSRTYSMESEHATYENPYEVKEDGLIRSSVSLLLPFSFNFMQCQTLSVPDKTQRQVFKPSLSDFIRSICKRR